MGLFDFPRLHVWGTQVANAGTGNNDSASPGTELTVTSNTERVGAETRYMKDSEFRRWMMSKDEHGLLRGQWNYFGDFSFRFIDVRVRSVQLGYDQPLSDPAVDPLVGASVYLNHAVMIDANPEGYHSTQVFSESLEIQAPGALGATGTFVSRKPTRATTRWLNWYRNVSYHGLFGLPPEGADGQLSSGGAGGASATFQCGIEVFPEDLEPVPHENDDADVVLHRLLACPESPGAAAVVDALRGRGGRRAHGLLFRYNLYLCFPRLSDTVLAKRFTAGHVQSNPAYGLVLGTICPWYDGEPSTITMGRYLKPAACYLNPYRQGDSAKYYLSPCVASVDRENHRISIDTANCLPEDGPSREKYAGLGGVRLGIRAASAPGEDPAWNQSPVLPIGALQNDRETFERQGGIYDISYAWLEPLVQSLLDVDDHELVLQTDGFGVLLYETEYMVETDCSCAYLDELPPGKSWDDPDVRAELARQPFEALRGEIDLHLRRRGRVPEEATPVTVEQWRATPTGYLDPDKDGVYRWPTLLGCESIAISGGRGKLPLRPAGGSGMRTYRFVPPGLWPRSIDPETFSRQQVQEFYADVRVLPYDDYSALAPKDVTWDVIYSNVFRYYYLILPAMSEYLDMRDRTIWETPTAARYVLRMTDPKLWGYYNYMPRTRDLSKYRRELLWRFCRNVIEGFMKFHELPEPPASGVPNEAPR